MGANKLNSYPVEQPPVPERPPFKLPHDTVEIDTVTPEKAWPSYIFDLSAQNIFGSANLATNDHGRTQEVLRAMKRTVPEALPPINVDESQDVEKKKHSYMDMLQDQNKKTRAYMTGDITIGGDKLPRVMFVKQSEVFTEIWRSLRAENHPLVQVVKQIIRENINRQNANKSLHPNSQMKTLTQNEIITLMDDLLITTHREEIKSGFQKRISQLKK